MSRPTPEMREFAERLVAFEMRGTKPSAAKLPPAFQICENLRPPLATLMGKAGFCALLSRALALAGAEAPRLRAVQVQADGSLAGLNGAEPPADPELVNESGVELVAQLFGLLVAFIGEALTLRMLREVWPKLMLSELYFRNEDPK